MLLQLVFDLCTKGNAAAACAIHKLIRVENRCPFSMVVFTCMYKIVVRSQCFVDSVFSGPAVQLMPLGSISMLLGFSVCKCNVFFFIKLSLMLLLGEILQFLK